MTPALYQQQHRSGQRRVGEPVTAVIARPAIDAGYQFQFNPWTPPSLSGSGRSRRGGCGRPRTVRQTVVQGGAFGHLIEAAIHPTSSCHFRAAHNGLHRLRVPAARGAVQFVRAVMAARCLCLQQHITCQGPDALEGQVKHHSSFASHEHDPSDGAITRVQEAFAFGANNE